MNTYNCICKKLKAAAVFVLLLALTACGGMKHTVPLSQTDGSPTAEEYYRTAMEYAGDRSYWQRPFEAFHLFQKAAEMNHVEAQERTGWGFQFGLGTDRDMYKAETWYRLAAEAGNANAMAILGVFFHKGLIGKNDPHQALYWTRKAARQGSPAGLNNMGAIYRNGHGVTRDYGQAVHYYRMAAKLGYPLAKSNLGAMYEKGLGVEKNIDTAYKLFRESCTDTDRYGFDGCYNLLRNAKTIDADDAEIQRAKEILEEACNDYQETACRYAGFVYMRGDGVERNSAQAADFWKRGSRLNDPRSLRLAAGLYLQGKGIAKNPELGIVLLQKACREGDQFSCLELEGFLKNDDS